MGAYTPQHQLVEKRVKSNSFSGTFNFLSKQKKEQLREQLLKKRKQRMESLNQSQEVKEEKNEFDTIERGEEVPIISKELTDVLKSKQSQHMSPSKIKQFMGDEQKQLEPPQRPNPFAPRIPYY